MSRFQQRSFFCHDDRWCSALFSHWSQRENWTKTSAAKLICGQFHVSCGFLPDSLDLEGDRKVFCTHLRQCQLAPPGVADASHICPGVTVGIEDVTIKTDSGMKT